MKSKSYIIAILLLCSIVVPVSAQVQKLDGDSLPYLNQQLRRTKQRLNSIESNTINSFSGILSLAKGGTGAALVDPGADRIMFWDESGDIMNWLIVGTGLDITGTTLSNTLETQRSEFISANGNFDVPAGVTKIWITMVGGGGGGGNADSNDAGGGGSGGAWLVNFPITVTPEATLAVQIGDGGAGGAASGNNNGAVGQDTIFDTGGDAITVSGGNFGISGASTGLGGAAVGGDFDASGVTGGGYNGLSGAGADGSVTNGGGGGGTPFGVGATGGTGTGDAGTANTGVGGSGGGGSTQAGGAGGSGFVLVQW